MARRDGSGKRKVNERIPRLGATLSLPSAGDLIKSGSV